MNEAMSQPRVEGAPSPVVQGIAATTSAETADPGLPQSRPPCIPDHELLRVIGAGAYGEVWLARNAVGTLRAVKIVRREAHASAESFEREFKGLRKFEPVSRAHEGLVDILTLGLLPDGAGFYYVMELADARPPATMGDEAPSLTSAQSQIANRRSQIQLEPHYVGSYVPRILRADLKSRGALSADEVIALGLKLTAALAHLHAQGLVHRDVKPSNILFIGGEPKLADAGLVAAVDDARSLVGTAGYIAPEGPGTPQADLYALGKVLYEAGFGKDRQEFPALPADIASRPDHARLLELNAILLKACAGDRHKRYQTADQMLGELEMLRDGQSIRRKHSWKKSLAYAGKGMLVLIGILLPAVAAMNLVWKGNPPEIRWSNNEQANDAYREGRILFDKNSGDSMHQAIRAFERAVELDPQFAHAYGVLARAYIWTGPGEPEVLRKARSAAEKALTLNRKLKDAHQGLAWTRAFLDHDWVAAEKEYQVAIKLNGRTAENLYPYASFLAVAGRSAEAVRLVEEALRSDTHTHLFLQNAAFVYARARQYDRAIELAKKVIEKEPSNRARLATLILAPAFRGKGDYLKAIQLEEEADLLNSEKPEAVRAKYDTLREAFKKGGAPAYWRKQLEFELLHFGDTNSVRLAILYAGCGDKETAFEHLNRASETTPTHLIYEISRESIFDHLRSDARFGRILNKLGMPK